MLVVIQRVITHELGELGRVLPKCYGGNKYSSGIKKANSLQSGTTKLEATQAAFLSNLIIVDLTTFQP